MAWARIDDAFDDHPKVLAVLEHEQGGAAIGLWTLCLTWAHRNTLRRGKTPGRIAASLPRRYLGPGARELAALLVKEGLWEPLPEGEGWQIHDFHLYLPTPKTSAARSEAGKKGASARWGKDAGRDGNLPSGDGKNMAADGRTGESGPPGAEMPTPSVGNPNPVGMVPSGDSNLPSGSHASDGKPMASDGSRAPAHRAISNEIASRDPIPVPPTAAQSARPDVTAGTLVAEWIKGCRKRPPDRVIGQVSAELKTLLNENHDVEDIRDGLTAWALAAKHPSTLASFVNTAMNGHPPEDRRQQAEQAQFSRAMQRAAAKEESS